MEWENEKYFSPDITKKYFERVLFFILQAGAAKCFSHNPKSDI